MTLLASALVMLGGFVGGVLRFCVTAAVGRVAPGLFPWGTLVVNVTGAFAIGVLAGAAHSSGGAFSDPLFRDVLVVGVLGGYTTVSSFSLQTLELALGAQYRHAVANIVLSAGLSVCAVAAGFWSAVRLFGQM
jgi:CrcB protein